MMKYLRDKQHSPECNRHYSARTRTRALHTREMLIIKMFRRAVVLPGGKETLPYATVSRVNSSDGIAHSEFAGIAEAK